MSSVDILCDCGRRVTVAEQQSGSLARCPACDRVLVLNPAPGKSGRPRTAAKRLAKRHVLPALALYAGAAALLFALILTVWNNSTGKPAPTAQAAVDNPPPVEPKPPPVDKPAQPAAVPIKEPPPVAKNDPPVPVPVEPEPVAAAPVGPPWQVLYDPAAPPPARTQMWRGLQGDVLSAVKFRGPGGDKNITSGFAADGRWQMSADGTLGRDGGGQAALRLGSAGDFELDATLAQSGPGGWFVLFGWNGREGWMLYQIRLKRTDIWYLYRAEQGEFPVRGEPLSDLRLHGQRQLALSVRDSVLRVEWGGQTIAGGYPLEGYRTGAIHLGTATTEYGETPLTIGRLRLRTPQPDAK